MSITLREHNQIAYEEIKRIFKRSNRAAVIHPTSTGKTYIALKLIVDNKDKKTLYLAHSTAILHNVKRTIIDANMTMADFRNLQRMTYQKLIRLSDEELNALEVDFIVVDEFHHCGAPEYEKGIKRLLKRNPDAKVLGLSATPIRFLDQCRDMAEELFGENIASEITVEEAKDKGILSDATYISALYAYNQRLGDSQDQIDKIPDEKRREEAQRYFNKLRDKLDEAIKNLPELLAKYMINKSGKYIVYCKDIDDMKEKQEQAKAMFGKVNSKIKLYSVSYEKNIKQNDRTLTAFEQDNEEGTLKLLYSVNMLNEGYQLEDLDGVIMMRPTISPAVFIQQAGRAFSVKKDNGKKTIIIDLVDNYASCKIIENFCERMSQYESTEGAKGKTRRTSNLTIFDNTKEIREIVDKITSLCNREKTIDELVNWFRKYPMARMDSREIYCGIEDVLKVYEPSKEKRKALFEEYNMLLKQYKFLSSKKVRESLTAEQLKKCRKGNLGGKFGVPEYFNVLAKKYRINVEKIKYIIYRYGSVESFIENYFEGTIDRLDEKVLGENIRIRFNIKDLNGSRGLDDLFDQVVNQAKRVKLLNDLPNMEKQTECFFYDGDKLLAYLSTLSESDNEIVRLRYGIGKNKGCTVKKIAEIMGVTQQKASVTENKIIINITEQWHEYIISPFVNLFARPYFGEAKEAVSKLREMIFKSNIIFYPDEEFASEPVSGIDIEELRYLLKEIKMVDPICTWLYSEDISDKFGCLLPKGALGISAWQMYYESDACRYTYICIPEFIIQVPNLSEETRKLALEKIRQHGYDKPVAPTVKGIPIENLGLSEKQYNVLKWNNIHVVEQLMVMYLIDINTGTFDIDLLNEKDKEEILRRIEALIEVSDKRNTAMIDSDEAFEQVKEPTELGDLRQTKMQAQERIQKLEEKECEARKLLKRYKELKKARDERGANTLEFND